MDNCLMFLHIYFIKCPLLHWSGWSDAKLQSSMSRTPNPLTNPPSNPQILSLFNPCKTPLEALPLYHTMLQSGLNPDHMTYPFVIKAYNESSVTWFGLLVHTHVVKSGFECDSYIVSSLIHGKFYSIPKNNPSFIYKWERFGCC